jgi:hypothetical protein
VKANGEFKIEKDIPIPPRGGRGLAAALRKMKVGDSVELPISTQSASNCVRQLFGPGHVTIRKTDKGCRVWLIA